MELICFLCIKLPQSLNILRIVNKWNLVSMAGNPNASSTPKIIDVKCREPIRNEDSIVSPIEPQRYTIKTFFEHVSHSQDEDINDFILYKEKQGQEPISENVDKSNISCNEGEAKLNNITDISETLQEQMQPTKTFHHHLNIDKNEQISTQCLVIVGILIVIMGWAFFPGAESEPKCNLIPFPHPSVSYMLMQQFPSQEENFGVTVQVLIEDIQTFKQPKSVIFLYDHNSAETMNKILKNISGEAVCRITSCCERPLELGPNNLTTVVDYGTIITEYKHILEKSGVMIVRNLEKIPGNTAQAFHSLCDEYYPVVKKALFLFTLYVPELPIKTPVDYTRNYLKSKWTELDETKFAPLFTRITSGFVMSVVREENVDS